MVTNVRGCAGPDLLVKNQMASRRVGPGTARGEHEERQQEGDGGLPETAFKISPGDMIWKMARIAMHSRLGQSVPMKFHMSMMPMKIPMTCMLVWFGPRGGDELEQQDERKGDQQHHEFGLAFHFWISHLLPPAGPDPDSSAGWRRDLVQVFPQGQCRHAWPPTLHVHHDGHDPDRPKGLRVRGQALSGARVRFIPRGSRLR